MTDDLTSWRDGLPEPIRLATLQYPPDQCYRMNNMGHYRIIGYQETAEGGVTVRLAHARDSYLPGIAVFGVDPSELEVCACGNWEYPLEEQLRFAERRIEAMRSRRNNEG